MVAQMVGECRVLRSTNVFRILIVALAVGWTGYKIGPQIWPDRRLTAIDQDILVGSRAENAHKLVARYRFKKAEFDGQSWTPVGRSFKPVYRHFPKELTRVPACAVAKCQFFMATRTVAPFFAHGVVEHAYRFYWAEGDGKIVKLITAHDLWRF